MACQCCGCDVDTSRNGLCYGCDLAGCSPDTLGCKHRKEGSSGA